MKRIQYTYKKAFSIIEVMIGIFIFTLGISAIYMIIHSTVSMNTYNKNFIIASNLAQEQIALMRNIRDSNYSKFQQWNLLTPWAPNINNFFTGSTIDFYRIENDFSDSTTFPIQFDKKTKVWDFKQALRSSTDTSEEIYRLCLDSKNRYVYCNNNNNLKETYFYKYIEIQPLMDKETGWSIIQDAFKVHSKVFWNQKWVHSVEVPTIITDWKRL